MELGAYRQRFPMSYFSRTILTAESCAMAPRADWKGHLKLSPVSGRAGARKKLKRTS
jgi:hypothetical protein